MIDASLESDTTTRSCPRLFHEQGSSEKLVAKQQEAKSKKRAKFVALLVVWCLDGMKDVSDRFLGVANELGREHLPVKQRDEFVGKFDKLLTDFRKRFPVALLESDELPPEWRRALQVALFSQGELYRQHGNLSGLVAAELKDPDADFRAAFLNASKSLLPIAKELRSALLSI
jgi:hypothetical protein